MPENDNDNFLNKERTYSKLSYPNFRYINSNFFNNEKDKKFIEKLKELIENSGIKTTRFLKKFI